MTQQPSTTGVTIPAVTLDVLDAPVSIEHAKANLDEHGYYTGIVSLPVHDIADHDIDYDRFYDALANTLVEDIEPYALSFQVLAVDPVRDVAYVGVSTDIASYLAAIGEDEFEGREPVVTLPLTSASDFFGPLGGS